MIKAWAHNNTSMAYKSYERMDDIISFLSEYYPFGRNGISYSKIVFEFYDYMSYRCSKELKSYIDTALERARKALEYEDNDKFKEASEEWRKILDVIFLKLQKIRKERIKVNQYPQIRYARG